MARVRKTDENKVHPKQICWKIGKYIRLSREDGNIVSESVINQEKILNDEIPSFFEDGLYEIVDTYIDDGSSGTSDIEREDFQRMVQDVKAGRINCIIVKNLSRAFRNSANQGHFLEEFIPLYHTRFISLYQPRLDTFLDPEIVHSLEVSITGFLNEQYAYKTSVDVRRTFKNKMQNGEFIGAFAPYGYSKDPNDKNTLIVDEEAAQVVRDIYSWFVNEGMSKLGIVKKLNELAIPNPTLYKRNKGLRFTSPTTPQNSGLWSSRTVHNILQDPIYIGVMRQGRQRVISYKVHKRMSIPENEWYCVEDAVTPLVDRDLYDKAQSLAQRDTRTTSENGEVYLFSGFVRCASCKKAMKRNKARQYVYYQCRTYREQSVTHCTKHTIRLDVLELAVLSSIQRQIDLIMSISEMIDKINSAPVVRKESDRLESTLKQKNHELEKASAILDGLYFDWKNGDINRDQYRRMKAQSEDQIAVLQDTIARLESERDLMAQGITSDDPLLSTFLKYRNVQSLSRALLVDLVDMIYVHDDGEIEIVFNFADQFHRIMEFIENNGQSIESGE